MDHFDVVTAKRVRAWLWFVLGMLLCMIFIGGITRLTDSGLSMVEWRPLLGVIPPLNEAEWLEVFDKYKQYPEYQIINTRMSLEEFKFIFFWEYFHRIFGRLIGLVVILPYLYFLAAKKLNRVWNLRFLFGIFLGGSQGLLGWFMVQSGLVDRPDVSHFRLAAHFSLALVILGYFWWLLLELKPAHKRAAPEEIDGASRKAAVKLMGFFMPVLALQIVYGAFVAGLKAGIGFNTFPKMGRHWMPKVLTQSGEFFSMAINSNAGVQFVHRCLAWILFAFAIAIVVFALKKLPKSEARKDFLMVSGLIFVQFLLGVATLLTRVDMWLASAHQMVACVLTLAAIKCFYDLAKQKGLPEIKIEIANKTTA